MENIGHRHVSQNGREFAIPLAGKRFPVSLKSFGSDGRHRLSDASLVPLSIAIGL